MGQYTQSVLTIVGYAVGTYFGYPALGSLVGSLVGGALQPNSKAQGPKLDDLKAPAFAYGSPIPRIRGRFRTAGCYIWASEKREIATTTEEGGKGGPGVDVTTYTYEMDALLLLSDGEIAAVTRVWSNGELVYNIAAGATPSTLIGTARNALWRDMRVYSGAADQLPDPIYEEAVGVGNAPAYRGRGTLMLEGLQLGQTGQVPLLTFEVLTSAEEIFSAPVAGPTQATPVYFNVGTPAIDTGILRVHVGQWDNAYASNLVYVYDLDLMQDTSTFVGIYTVENSSSWGVGQGNSDTDCLLMSKSGDRLHLYRPADGLLSEYTAPDSLGSSQVVFSALGNDLIVGSNLFGAKSLHRFSVVGGLGYVHASSAPLPDYVSDIRIHGGLVYAVDKTTGQSLYVLDLTTLALLDTIDTPMVGWGTNAYVRLLTFRGNLAIWIPGDSRPNGLQSIHMLVEGEWVHVGDMPLSSSFLPGLSGGQVIGTIGNLIISGQRPTTGGVYVTQSVSIVIQPGELDLEEEALDLTAQAGVAPVDVEASDLAGIPVMGYAVTQVTAARTMLELLAAAYYFECVESDKLYFRRRGGELAAALTFEQLGARDDEADSEDPIGLVRSNDSEVPARVSLAYVNIDNDYQTGSVDSDRLIGVSAETRTVQLPIVMEPAQAKGIANTMVMDARVAATTFRPAVAFSTEPELEPTDVITLRDEDDVRHRARIVRETLSTCSRQFEAVLDDPTVLQSVGITYEGTTPSTEVSPPADTTLALLDIPLLRDADDYPGLYAAGKSRGGKWPGFSVFRSSDDVTFENLGTATRQAIIGSCKTVLGDWTGGFVFDETNTVTVNVGSATLASCSRDDILNGDAPGYMVGAELVYARNATLVSPGLYTLSSLLRGRRGTDWATVGHEAAERFAVLANNGLLKTALGAIGIGSTFYWRGITTGRPLSSASSIAAPDTGIVVKPFSPVDARASGNPRSGAITITWKRRTRYECRFAGPAGIYVPLGEASEAYEIDVYEDDTFATVVRTLAAGEQQVDYSASDQNADFGTLPSSLSVEIFQISAVRGRGYPLRVTFGGLGVSMRASAAFRGSDDFVMTGIDARSTGALITKWTVAAAEPNWLFLPDAAGLCVSLPFSYTGWKGGAIYSATPIGMNVGGALSSGVTAVLISLAGAGVFSRLEWSGSGGTRSIPHGLGVTPSLAMVKRSAAENWWMYSTVAGAGNSLRFPNGGVPLGFASDANAFPNASDATDFKVGSDLNQIGYDHVGLVFAGTSSDVEAGTYTGNGSTSGPVVSLPWEPDILIIQSIDGTPAYAFITCAALAGTTATHWFLTDSGTAPEFTAIVDRQTDGFQPISSHVAVNESGTTYQYWARKRI